jgi:hypothetical protein
MKKHLVVLTGAGVSAESGLQTFRDSDGLWMGYDVYEVASPAGWEKDECTFRLHKCPFKQHCPIKCVSSQGWGRAPSPGKKFKNYTLCKKKRISTLMFY